MRLKPRILAGAVAGLAAITVAVVALVLRSPPAAEGPGDIAVTIYPRTPVPTETPRLVPTDAPTAFPTASITAVPLKHIVQAGDTLWDIALKYDVSADDLLFINPGLKPELLQIGQEIQLPGLYEDPSVLGTPPAAGTPYVSIEADGLRLREQPAIGSNILRKLPAYSAVKITRRSADGWYQVTADGRTGWVFGPYVQLNGVDVASIPSDAPIAVARAPGPSGATAAPGTPQPVKTPFVIPDDPYVSGVGARAREIYKAGQQHGTNARVFSVIGDSNSENPKFLKPFDWGTYDLGNYGFLQETLDWFHGSYGRTSLAAYGGFNTTKVLDPAESRGPCGGQAPLDCELRTARPSVALVLLGTGDQHTWQGFEGRYRKIIETLINAGAVPVLMTKGDDLECRDNNAPCGYINGIIVRLAREYSVPLLDLRRAINNLPNRGMVADGFHFNWSPDDQPANFTGADLGYGFNIRNLTALRALDTVRRQVIGPVSP